MTDELVAYLLDDLCPERRGEVERRLETDDAWRCEYQRLKECFADGCNPAPTVVEPPKDLVVRTCCLVDLADKRRAENTPSNKVRRRDGEGRGTPIAAFVAAPACPGGLANWSLADVSVGGGVILLLGMLIVPAMRESRDASRRAQCQNNLAQLGTASFDYQINHGRWLPTIAPGQSASEYWVALAEHGGADRRQLAQWILCPESRLADQVFRGERKVAIPSEQELARMFGQERAQAIRDMAGDYAIKVGYFDASGAYHYLRYTGKSNAPMIADAPAISAGGARTINHVGGQNVLSEDLSAPFRANMELAESLDNIYLNMLGQHAAGYDPDDVVLLKGDFGPNGPMDFLQAIGQQDMVPSANK